MQARGLPILTLEGFLEEVTSRLKLTEIELEFSQQRRRESRDAACAVLQEREPVMCMCKLKVAQCG